MSRLLLGEDLSLYTDGEQEGPAPPEIPEIPPAELPYFDGRLMGRVLMVGADGALVWKHLPLIPSVHGRDAGTVLTVASDGSLIWSAPAPGGESEVFATDFPAQTNSGVLFYGPDDPDTGVVGDLWIVTRSTITAPPIPAPTLAPTLTAGSPGTGTTVALSWTEVADATEYRIAVDAVDVLQVDALETTITLAEGTHSITVRATNPGGDGPPSVAASVTIVNQPPPPVTDLAVGDITDTTVNVEWEYPDKPTDWSTYVVATTAGTVFVIDQTGRTAKITGLAPGTATTITVTARDTGGLDSLPVQVGATTDATPPPTAPTAPVNLRTTRIGYSSADIAWNAVSGATSYEWGSNGTSWTAIGTATTRTWGGLAESTNYRIYVRAKNAAGAGPASSYPFKTLPKVKSYTTTHATRTFGYGAESIAGLLTYFNSGVLFTNDNWATGANSHLYAFDNNLNTGPYSAQGDRWITFNVAVSCDYIYSVTGWWGYPGTFTWNAYNSALSVQQIGKVAGSGGAMTAGPNNKNVTIIGTRLTYLQMSYGAGLGSPGWYKLREMQFQVRQITGSTPVYNPA